MIILCITLLILIFFSGFFSASETALFSLSTLKVKTFRQDPNKAKQAVAQLLSKPRDLLVTIIMLNVSINILIQNVSSSIFGDFANWSLNVGVPLVLTLFFGDIIPKSIALMNNTAIALKIAPFITRSQKILLPIRFVLVKVTNFVSSCLFFFLKKGEEISIDELQHALRTSKKFGVLNDEEAKLVRGYLNLQEFTVKELVRPREEVIYFDLQEPLDKLVHLFVDQECSRIPVCNGGIDSLVGIMTSQIFFLHQPHLKATPNILDILEKPFFVPESIAAKSLLRQFYEKNESLAIVVDEYGSISGLIALEDLFETVVGEITDRRDEKKLYTKSGEDVIIASGKLELAEIEEIFDVTLTSQNHMVTTGGYLTEKMGDIPKSGMKYTSEDLFFHVLSADHTRVRRVYIRRIKKK